MTGSMTKSIYFFRVSVEAEATPLKLVVQGLKELRWNGWLDLTFALLLKPRKKRTVGRYTHC